MNFEVLDFDFENDKEDYQKKLKSLSQEVISKEYLQDWSNFSTKFLINTRNYYLLKTALKVMKNLNNNLDFDTSVFNSLSFMPDQTFVETTIMIITRYHNQGKNLADHFNVDVSDITKAEKNAKIVQQNQSDNKKSTYKNDKVEAENAVLASQQSKATKPEHEPERLTVKSLIKVEGESDKFVKKAQINQIKKSKK